MIKHLNITIYGEVIDVNFRSFAKSKASEFGVFGFVQNQPDGTVYIEAEGEEENLQEFLKACKQGPRFAVIEKVKTSVAEIKNFKDFRINY